MLTSSAARDARRRRDRDRRRDPRPRPDQARRPPRPVARAARGDHRPPAAAHRAVGHAAPAGGGRPLPRRLRRRPASRGRSRSSTPASASRWRSRSSSRSRTWATSAGEPVELRSGPADGGARRRGASSIWPSIYPRILDQVLEHRSTIIFCNARRQAERLAAKLNELAEERGIGVDPETGRLREELVKAHHGSLAREQRVVVEDQLKRGDLRAIVATSSLELGIDMGAVDLVIQVESPGRGQPRPAAHRPGRPPGRRAEQGLDLPEAPRRPARGGGRRAADARRPDRVDPLPAQPARRARPADRRPRRGAAARRPSPSVAALVRRCANFAELSDEQLANTLDLLAGRYPSEEFSELRPRLVWDRVNDTRAGPRRLEAAGRHVAAARSPTAGCSACSCPTARGSASSTRRWSTRAGRARRSCSARRRGGSRTSRSSGSPSRRRRASRARCRSGTATGPAGRSSSGRALGAFVRELRELAAGAGASTLLRDDYAPRRAGGGQPACSTSTSRPRPPASCPTTARSSSSASATRSATGGSACSARSARRSTRRGRWRSSAG